MSKNALIVLNYNNYEETKRFVEEVKDYPSLEAIVIVDNASKNESFQELSKLASDRIHVILSPTNQGYASGNNFGVKYAETHIKPDYYIISNPDVIVTNDAIQTMTDFVTEKSQTEQVGAVAPIMLGPDEAFHLKNTGWKLPTFKSDVISMFAGLARRHPNYLNYDNQDLVGTEYVPVDVLPGSFFMIPATSFKQVDFFDEQTFLFCEERILSHKLLHQGYHNYLLTNCSYIHNHSTTIKSNISKINTYKHFLASKKIYHRDYLNNSSFKQGVFHVLAALSLLEKQIIYRLQDKTK